MTRTAMIAILAFAPFGALAHTGPAVSSAQMLQASPVALALSAPVQIAPKGTCPAVQPSVVYVQLACATN